MDNQQLSTLDSRIKLLARNGRLGDGNLWKNPRGNNAKYITTSTNTDILALKERIVPEVFQTGIRHIDTTNHKGRYPNAKPIFRLASIVHPIFTEYKEKERVSIYEELTLTDMVLWFKDDGCVYDRKDSNSKRYILSIGESINSVERLEAFDTALTRLFGTNYGRFEKNNSKASINNFSWMPTKDIGELLVTSYAILSEHYGESSTTIP